MKNIFAYGPDSGGLGDFVKSLKMYIEYCLREDIQIHIHIANPNMTQYIVIKEEYVSDMNGIVWGTSAILRDPKFNENEMTCNINLFDYFDFHKKVYDEYEKTIEHICQPYDAIHVRMGDQHGNPSFPCRNNDRTNGISVEMVVGKIVSENNGTLVLLADNSNIKDKLKALYPSLITFSTPIIHLDSYYSINIQVNDDDVLRNYVEYLILCKCQTIHSIGKSGFSFTANWFYKNKIIHYK